MSSQVAQELSRLVLSKQVLRSFLFHDLCQDVSQGFKGYNKLVAALGVLVFGGKDANNTPRPVPRVSWPSWLAEPLLVMAMS